MFKDFITYHRGLINNWTKVYTYILEIFLVIFNFISILLELPRQMLISLSMNSDEHKKFQELKFQEEVKRMEEVE